MAGLSLCPDMDDLFDTLRHLDSNHYPDSEWRYSQLSETANTSPVSDSLFNVHFFTEEHDAFYDDEGDLLTESNSPIQYSVASTSEVIAPKVCAICSEATSCCHYDVPSCSGCKTFFRRSVLSPKDYVCKKNNNCDIANGAKCRACRFDRCIAVGMNPAGIKLPEDVQLASVLEKINSRKRNMAAVAENEGAEENQNSNGSEYVLSLVPAKKNPVFELTLESRDIEFLCFLESKVKQLRESNYNPRPLYECSVAQILERKTALRMSDKYEKPPHWPMNGLLVAKEHHEKHQINSLWRPRIQKRHWLAIDLILFIEMAKTIPVIEKLDSNDRLLVIKNCLVLNTVLTQAYYSYEAHSDTFRMPDGIMPIMMGPPQEDAPHLKKEAFSRVMEPFIRMQLTKEEYVLLKVIMACSPAVKDISDKSKKLLEKEFDRYSKILLRHVQTRIGAAPGAVRYSLLMAMYEAMTHFAQKHKELHVYFDLKRLRMIAENPGHILPPHITIADEALK